jgi:peptide chain release factor 2
VHAPHQLVKDLPTGLENGNPEAALDGDLDEFMAASSGATRSEASANAR